MNDQERHATPFITSTVRVGQGAGVILKVDDNKRVVLTAAHVVRSESAPVVTHPAHSYPATVLARNDEADLAVLTDHPRLGDVAGVTLGDPPPVGSEVLLTGYPKGWTGPVALLARGLLAGATTHATWVQGDASWGHSGGGVFYEGACSGIILGRAGSVSDELRDALRDADELERQVAAAQRRNDEQEKHQPAEAGMSPETLASVPWGLRPFAPLLWAMAGISRNAAKRQADSLTYAVNLVIRTTRALVALDETHFRSGFLSVATAERIRELLP